jgi:hypothetical protein
MVGLATKTNIKSTKNGLSRSKSLPPIETVKNGTGPYASRTSILRRNDHADTYSYDKSPKQDQKLNSPTAEQ